MDSEDFRSILESAGVDVWALMDAAIAVASADHAHELKRRRDGIVERLYAASSPPPLCRNCDAGDGGEIRTQSSPSAEEEKDPYGGLFDDEQRKILDIKEQLEDPHQVLFLLISQLMNFCLFFFLIIIYQPKDLLVELLPNLVNMNITI